MLVPKCRECGYHHTGAINSKQKVHYCYHPQASKNFKYKDIWVKEMGKTSPKWCPLRKEGGA